MDVHEYSSLLSVLFIGLFLLVVILIGLLLVSLAKQGDERRKHIKAQSMSQTLYILVAVLIVDVVRVFISDLDGNILPLKYLLLISIVFLTTLIFNKKKFGD